MPNQRDKNGEFPFTDAQIEALRRIAEARDVTRDRGSLFSTGEQIELDDTARNLDFNVKQRRELEYRLRKRWLPLLGYLILALGTGYAVEQARSAAVQQAAHHSNLNREQATATTRVATEANCASDNTLRAVLRGIVNDSKPQITEAVHARHITPAEGRVDLQSINKDLKALAKIDCKALVAQVH